MRRPCSLATSFARSSITRLLLWGFVKERVMVVAPTTPDDMKERTHRACTDITPQMLAEICLDIINSFRAIAL